MMVVSWGWEWSMMSSIRVVACISVMPLRFSDADGGRYTFTILILWLFGSAILFSRAYSFPFVYSIANYFFMYVAMPPRVPMLLLSSTMLYPASSGESAAGAIHVS
jgi:hypothetical protein